MKKIITMCMVSLLGASLLFAADLTEADQKWSAVVEKMIVEGSTEISTPSAQRVEIVKSLAKKHNAKTTVVKTENGFRIHIKINSIAEK